MKTGESYAVITKRYGRGKNLARGLIKQPQGRSKTTFVAKPHKEGRIKY